ncbi:MAG: GNAT family N-acetyltransferase [Clostridia bacterium]|nr:GNAT family N-acetyltransferase [Clostridia bacterium]
MRTEALTAETVRKYRGEIARFYFDNISSCSCMSHYTFGEAYEKIGDFIRYLDAGEAIGYGLFEKAEICGYIWAYPHQFREEKRVYVNEIRIREDCRGQGYGKELLRLVEERAKEMGINAVYLHAEANNPSAVGFYHANGYEEERVQFRKEIAQDQK